MSPVRSDVPSHHRPSDVAATASAPRDPNEAIQASILPNLAGYALRRAQVALFQDFARTMARLAKADPGLAPPVTPGEFGVLALIHANPGAKQTTLAQAIGIERSTMVAVIDGLERRGFVRRDPAPDDRRSHALFLSRAGAAAFARLETAVHAHEEHFLSPLTAAERVTLCTLLRRLSALD